ncbi:hypothetical protein OUZ56_025056 [Daphnia magna]|uniref:Uncharacterized protein n=1 Tax=Daphnia magna TaxID=35525 RepID=A0ABQ9ZIP7_9CRUS|nr:hypothetical protein OUZ56_025056 [Daphnia magna]
MLPGTALAGDLEVSDYDIRGVIKPIRFLYDTEKFQGFRLENLLMFIITFDELFWGMWGDSFSKNQFGRIASERQRSVLHCGNGASRQLEQ